MNIHQSIFLGVVQGLTEFLPISSSAHLVFIQHYLGIERIDLLFSLMVHFATATAIFYFYRQEIYNIFLNLRTKDSHKKNISVHLLILILISMVPTAVVALILKGSILQFMSNIRWISILLLVTGAIVFATDRIKEKGVMILETPFKAAFFIGLAQGIALLPGISRSGITILMGLVCGLDRSWAVKLSFLISLPIIAGMTITKIIMESGQIFMSPMKFLVYLVGSIIAGVIGYWSIKIVLRFIIQKHFKIFAIYCWILGVLILIKSSI